MPISDLENVKEIKTIKNQNEKICANTEKLETKINELQKELNMVFDHLITINNNVELISNNAGNNNDKYTQYKLMIGTYRN